MYVIYVTITDDYTYSYDIAYGFARTDIGALELEDKAKIEYNNCDCRIERIEFIEDKEKQL